MLAVRPVVGVTLRRHLGQHGAERVLGWTLRSDQRTLVTELAAGMSWEETGYSLGYRACQNSDLAHQER